MNTELLFLLLVGLSCIEILAILYYRNEVKELRQKIDDLMDVIFQEDEVADGN